MQLEGENAVSLRKIFPVHITGPGIPMENCQDPALKKELHFINKESLRTNEGNEYLKQKTEIVPFGYRPFDTRYYLADKNVPSENTSLLSNPEAFRFCLNTVRFSKDLDRAATFITRVPAHPSFLRANGGTVSFPLYIREDNSEPSNFGRGKLKPNLNENTMRKLALQTGLTFVPEKDPEGNVCMAGNREVRNEFKITFSPINVLDYVYALLHSSSVRIKLQPALEFDVPAIPLPNESGIFWQLVDMGGALRKIHLLESPETDEQKYQFVQNSRNQSTCLIDTAKIRWEASREKKNSGRAWINSNHFIDNIPSAVWDFYIGDFQPARQWLFDRTGNILTKDDIQQYQAIIAALSLTVQIKKDICKLLEFHFPE